jgi:hypothetical protein
MASLCLAESGNIDLVEVTIELDDDPQCEAFGASRQELDAELLDDLKAPFGVVCG